MGPPTYMRSFVVDRNVVVRRVIVL